MTGRGPGNVRLPPPQEPEEIEKVTSTTASTATSPGEFSLSPGSVDRVFPIRSVIEPNVNNLLITPPHHQVQEDFPSPPSFNVEEDLKSPVQSALDARLMAIPDTKEMESRISEMNSSALLEQVTAEVPKEGNYPARGLYTTNRHKHVETQDGHMVITGVRGSEKLQRCEDEPIHIPGAVQKFGCLVAFKRPEDLGNEDDEDEDLPMPNLDIRIVSENSEDIIGYSPHELFMKGDLCNILSDDEINNMLDHIDYVLKGEGPRKDGPEVFQLSLIGPDAALLKVWCSLHVPEANPDLVICEFELEDDSKYPVNNGPDDGLTAPENTLGYEPPEEVLTASSTSLHKPLRKLRNSRRRKGQDVLEVFNTLAQIQEQMTSAETLETLMNVTVGITKELVGFHRIMIYQFDEAANGKVVAEIIQKGITCDLYMGLHFPASDIPAQARELYRINKVRLLYDREHETARLVCKNLEDLQKPLDLAHSQLRAMSPIHVKYLKHMGVRASMSISLTAFGQLWGLISCHSYHRGMRVPFPVRKMCRLVGENASRNIERISMSRRLYTRLINVSTEQNPSGYFVANSDDLLKLVDADCGLLSIRDETKVLGVIEDSQESLALLEYLRMKNFSSVTHSRDLKKDFPDLRYPPGFKSIAGLMLVPLSSNGDFIVFFRKPQLKKVNWAGNPHEKVTRPGTEGYLEPRKSFALWTETVVGKSQEWTLEQTETAAVLCLVYGKFIAVWRQKEAALKSSQLTRLLLANASHEVRTPLNAIINYLEIALEGPLDNGTRENLVRSHSASKSLIYVINDLLDLTRTEGGRALIQEEEFDLRQTINDAVAMFKPDAFRKGLLFDVVEYAGLPTRVKGDPKRLRKTIQNITANALEYTVEGSIKIEVWANPMEEGRTEIEVAVQDTGIGMSPDKVDILFKELEQTEDEKDPQREEDEDVLDTISGNSGQKMLGLGLAVVARTIRILKGQLKVNSVEGKGSRFTISIPVEVCESASSQESGQSLPGSGTASPTLRPEIREGSLELLHPTRTLRSRASTGNLTSRGRSNSASTIASEIDRLFADLESSRAESPQTEGSTPVLDLSRIQSAPKPTLPSIIASPPLTRPPLQHRSSSKGVTATYTPAYEKRSYFGVEDETVDLRPQITSISPALEKVLRKHQSPPTSPPTIPTTTTNSPKLAPAKALHDTKPPSPSASYPPKLTNINNSLVPPSTSPKPSLTPSTITSHHAVPSGAVVPRPPSQQKKSPPATASASPPDNILSVLVAEDDPINSKIIKKRLEKMGHRVVCYVNGLMCLEAFIKEPGKWDAVLMDMQMPIMDGATAAAKIRAHEAALGSLVAPSSASALDSASLSSSSAWAPTPTNLTHPTTTSCSSPISPPILTVTSPPRIPIFAVSASLREQDMPEYRKIGFDGWMLKPIDFRRLARVLLGIREAETKRGVEYREGEWELGGWFRS